MDPRKKLIVVLVLVYLLSGTVAVKAEDASELIGSITGYVEEIQNYPAVIDEALCNGDREEYQLKMGELADLIQAANDAMAGAGLPNTLNLWAVYGAITANPSCGVATAALSKADWSREELDRIGYKYGLFDTWRQSIQGKQLPQICGLFTLGITMGEAVTITGEVGGDCVKAYGEDRCSLIVDTCTYSEGWPTNDHYFYSSSKWYLLPGE